MIDEIFNLFNYTIRFVCTGARCQNGFCWLLADCWWTGYTFDIIDINRAMAICRRYQSELNQQIRVE